MQPLPHLVIANFLKMADRPRKIVIGLGNPGSKYAQTRHNLGFSALDHCADLLNVNFIKDRDAQSMIAKKRSSQRDLLLIKPLTYMNLSGQALFSLKKTMSYDLHQILVICDDIALPVGAMRLRLKGGTGGHNGLKSIRETFGSGDFARLRIGIGQPPSGMGLDQFVLGLFCEDEKREIAVIIEKAAGLALTWAEGEEQQLKGLIDQP